MESRAFVRQILTSFFVSVTFITLTMAVVGVLFEPDVRLSYGILFSPLIFGALGTLPQIVTYSRKAMTLRQIIFRKVLQALLLEAVILLALFWAQALTSHGITVAIALSVALIYVMVTLIMWLNDRKTSHEFNEALQVFQETHQR